MTTMEWLSDYDIKFPTSMELHSASHSSGGSNGQSAKNSKSKSREEVTDQSLKPLILHHHEALTMIGTREPCHVSYVVASQGC